MQKKSSGSVYTRANGTRVLVCTVKMGEEMIYAIDRYRFRPAACAIGRKAATWSAAVRELVTLGLVHADECAGAARKRQGRGRTT